MTLIFFLENFSSILVTFHIHLLISIFHWVKSYLYTQPFYIFNPHSFVGGTRRPESMAVQSCSPHPDGPVFRGVEHRQQIENCRVSLYDFRKAFSVGLVRWLWLYIFLCNVFVSLTIVRMK